MGIFMFSSPIEPIIFEPKDYPDKEWELIEKIFNTEGAERIVLSDFILEVYKNGGIPWGRKETKHEKEICEMRLNYEQIIGDLKLAIKNTIEENKKVADKYDKLAETCSEAALSITFNAIAAGLRDANHVLMMNVDGLDIWRCSDG